MTGVEENISGPAYRVETERLVIRCWELADAPLAKAAIDANIEHLKPWMPWALNEPTSLTEKLNLMRRFRGAFDLGQDFTYAVFNRAEDRVLGGTGLHPRVGEGAREIGYWIDKDHTNQGLATEVAAALTKVAFQVEQVFRVEIHIEPHNLRSAAVPRKLGFAHEATLRRHQRLGGGEFRDTMIWTLFDDQYPESPCAEAAVKAFDGLGRRLL